MKNTVRTVSQSPAVSPTAPSGRAIIAIVGVLVVAVVAVSAIYKPWQALIADPATPPSPPVGDLEPALVQRIAELTDQIKAASDDAQAWA